MSRTRWSAARCCVALLAEGVGRNSLQAWTIRGLSPVALLAEGVGRNDVRSEGSVINKQGRPPRGGRG